MNGFRILQEFTVILEDRPGAVADMLDALTGRGINILGIVGHAEEENPSTGSVADVLEPREGLVRFTVDEVHETATLLENGDFRFFQGPILAIPLMNHPGAAAVVARILAEAQINVLYMYGGGAANEGYMFLRVSNPDQASDVLHAGLTAESDAQT